MDLYFWVFFDSTFLGDLTTREDYTDLVDCLETIGVKGSVTLYTGVYGVYDFHRFFNPLEQFHDK